MDAFFKEKISLSLSRESHVTLTYFPIQMNEFGVQFYIRVIWWHQTSEFLACIPLTLTVTKKIIHKMGAAEQHSLLCHQAKPTTSVSTISDSNWRKHRLIRINPACGLKVQKAKDNEWTEFTFAWDSFAIHSLSKRDWWLGVRSPFFLHCIYICLNVYVKSCRGCWFRLCSLTFIA